MLHRVSTRFCASMEKFLFAICLLTAVFILSTDPGRDRGEWEISLHAGEGLGVDLTIEYLPGPVE